MASSQGMRKQPLMIIITTAGFRLHSYPCFEYTAMCKEILKGVKKDDNIFALIYQLDENDDWEDESVWIKANPSLEQTVSIKYLRDQITSAKNQPSLEVGVKTKNLNMWCQSQDTWITQDLLLDSTDEVNYDNFKECTAYIGVDLASVSDLTAVSVMIPFEGKFYFKNYYYLPESCLTDNINQEKYLLWHKEGYLTLTSGNVTDYDIVTKDLLNVSEKVYIDKVAYDQYNSTQWAIDCTAEGLPLIPYSQALWSFNRPTKEFERLIKMGKIIIDNNPITRWCFANIAIKSDYNENIKPVKGGAANQKIDGAIAMIEALGIYLDQPQYNNQIMAIPSK